MVLENLVSVIVLKLIEVFLLYSYSFQKMYFG